MQSFSLTKLREKLGVSQAELGQHLGMTQGNVSFYERGQQTMPPHVAKRLIDFAASRRVKVTFNQIYGSAKG